MSISIDIPENVERTLRRVTESLEAFAKEAFAVEAYRAGKLSIGQFAELLGAGQYEADGILKAHGVYLEQSEQQSAAERERLNNVLDQ